MKDLHFPRALFEIRGGQIDLIAHSPAFQPHWQDDYIPFLQNCVATPLPDTPFESLIVADLAGAGIDIVRVRHQPNQPTRFALLSIEASFYSYLPDPFHLDERFPPQWQAQSWLDDAIWPSGELPARRTVEQLQKLFREGDGPLYLSAAQALVDSGKVLLIREQPPEQLFREIWQFLPYSVQRTTSLCTRLLQRDWLDSQFLNLVSTSEMIDPVPIGWIDEERLRYYPESVYERDLQIAIEMGEQFEIERLFARRSQSQTLKLGVYLAALLILFLVVIAFLK